MAVRGALFLKRRARVSVVNRLGLFIFDRFSPVVRMTSRASMRSPAANCRLSAIMAAKPSCFCVSTTTILPVSVVAWIKFFSESNPVT
jgi:hypothetical protein